MEAAGVSDSARRGDVDAGSSGRAPRRAANRADAALVAVGLNPHDKLGASRKFGPSSADALDDQDGSRRHLNRSGSALHDPARRPEVDRLATPPRRDDAIDEDVRPVDLIVVPSDVVGVHHCAVEKARQALGEGRLPAARPAVHQDECVFLLGEQRTHADG